MSASGNGQGGRLERLTAEQTRLLLDQDRSALYVLVDADGRTMPDGVSLPVTAPKPLAPAPVSLPVSSTAAELEIRAEGEATAFGIRLDHERRRGELRSRLQGERAELASRWQRRDRTREELDRAVTAWEAFLDGLPRRTRRLLRRRWGRIVRWVPWCMWGADTMFLSRAYGLFGPLPLPFTASVAVTNVTQVLRAGLVSFGLVFGARLVGTKLRDLADELRDRHALLGLTVDGAVGGLVLVAAVRLAESTARIQQALLAIEAGGTSLHLPVSVLFSIVSFLVSVSLACGYYLNEPELDEARQLEQRVDTAKAMNEQAEAECYLQLGVVRATREELQSVDGRETLELAENEAHTGRRVFAHKAGNPHFYGLEMTPASASNGGGTL